MTPLNEIEVEMSQEEALAVLDGPEPTHWSDIANWASAYYLMGDMGTALRWAFRAYGLKKAVKTCINLAVILNHLGKFREALPYAREAYACDPLDERTVMLLSECLLRLERFMEGWSLYSRFRDKLQHPRFRDIFPPEWQGPHQSLEGKKILVCEYGGVGDNLFFLRWLKPIARSGAKITYVCRKELAPLLEEIGYETIPDDLPATAGYLRQWDYFTSCLTLPGKFQMDTRTYHWDGPYVRLPRKLRWPTRKRIGFCDRAGEYAATRKTRTLNSLQYEMLASRLGNFELINDRFPDWLATAEAISQLSLFVTVDTGAAHLAGAMGIPTWVILPSASAWQYLTNYKFHPFYPSMRLFRSQNEGLDDAVSACIMALEEKRI